MKRSRMSRGTSELKRTPMKRGRKRMRTFRDPKLIVWSRAVKKRDDQRCQWPRCARQGLSNTLDAHHKATRSQRPDLKYEISNGITLCRWHHEFTHHEGKQEAVALGILSGETYEAAQKKESFSLDLYVTAGV